MKFIAKAQTAKGPAETFTGDVYVDTIKPAMAGSNYSMSSVHFTPGARAAWHSHPQGQMIYVIEGIGLIQKRGEPMQVIRAGDAIWTEPNEEHWHGATADHFMTHIVVQTADEQGNFADWHEHVSDEEYGQQPQVD